MTRRIVRRTFLMERKTSKTYTVTFGKMVNITCPAFFQNIAVFEIRNNLLILVFSAELSKFDAAFAANLDSR